MNLELTQNEYDWIARAVYTPIWIETETLQSLKNKFIKGDKHGK